LHCCFPFVGAVVRSTRLRFAEVLRRRREALGVSQEALAAAAGLHRNYVGLLERGKRIPSILVVERLAAALETSMASLLRAVENA
jgi:transcriptional regulator with XRE-family HTH domain